MEVERKYAEREVDIRQQIVTLAKLNRLLCLKMIAQKVKMVKTVCLLPFKLMIINLYFSYLPTYLNEGT